MDDNLVSIITPMYNGARYVAETIDSVIAQTYPHWEMLIVDDGSKDNGPQIVESYATRDPRIRLIRQPNGGSANARNHAIREAKGRYIVLLDADDVWEPNLLEEQLRFMAEKHAEFVYASYKRIDENGKEILKPLKCKKVITNSDMQVRNYVGCPLTGVYDSKNHGKIYLHEELKSLRDDYAYWVDVVKAVGIGYGNPKVLARYRVITSSTTGKKKKLVLPQYRFYRTFLHQSPIAALWHTFRWGLAGFINFGGFKALK